MIITVTCTTEAAVKLKHEKKKSQGDQFPDGLRRNPIEDGAISGLSGQKSVPE